MSISVSVSSPGVSASVSGGVVSASVSAPSTIGATVAGGIGPTGPAGVNQLADATDVQLSSVADGDVLRYSSSKWRNYADTNLTDGGNF